jgi:hypothetical protein
VTHFACTGSLTAAGHHIALARMAALSAAAAALGTWLLARPPVAAAITLPRLVDPISLMPTKLSPLWRRSLLQRPSRHPLQIEFFFEEDQGRSAQQQAYLQDTVLPGATSYLSQFIQVRRAAAECPCCPTCRELAPAHKQVLATLNMHMCTLHAWLWHGFRAHVQVYHERHCILPAAGPSGHRGLLACRRDHFNSLSFFLQTKEPIEHMDFGGARDHDIVGNRPGSVIPQPKPGVIPTRTSTVWKHWLVVASWKLANCCTARCAMTLSPSSVIGIQ